jgi:pilus assembly protein CpaB
MRAKTLILFMIAISCGLVASIGVSQYMERGGKGGTGADTTKIFVAITDINIGDQLNEQNIRLEEWPKQRVPEGAISQLDDLQDRFPRTRLYAGEPILRAKLMDSNDGSKSVDIPKGFRVVSVKVSMESSVSGLVQPGDRVDLMVLLKKSNEVPETGTRTILRDVNIFAVDSETERNVDADGSSSVLRTVSLLVKPDQAETITLASGLGSLFLTLRRPDDDQQDDSEGITVHKLLGSEPESARSVAEAATTVVPTQAGPEQPGFVQWLAQTAAAVAPQVADIPVQQAAPAWTMKILTPDGCREFRWRDVNELPDEVLPAMEPLATPVSRQIVPPPAADPGDQDKTAPADGAPISTDAA